MAIGIDTICYRSKSTAAALSLAALTLAPPASALIVWNGKVVDRWPDEAVAHPGSGSLLAAPAPGINLYPSPKGTVWGLTLLVDFSDQAAAFTKEEVEEWLNQEGFDRFGCNGSVRDYFKDNSNGQVDFQNDVFGFYRAQNPKSYYEGGSGYQRASELVAEVMAYFDSQVDFSKYDNDGNGRTDAISIVYAGFGENWGQGIWPHAGGLNEQRDGVRLSRYMMSDLKDEFTIYTFAHEVGHMLFGWPDLYGFGNYCIMGNGANGQNPPGINDTYRADQGWIPIVDVDSTTNLIFQAVHNGAAYRYLNPNNPEEAFIWSNVQSTGRFATIQGDGILVLHFDKGIGNNEPPNELSLAVVQADGLKELDQTMWPSPGSDVDDYFRADGVHEFSKETHATNAWNDGSDTGLRIYDVGAVSESMEFKVGYGTPTVADAGVPMGGGGNGGGSGSGGDSGSGSGGTAGTGTIGGAGSTGLPSTGGTAPTAGSSNTGAGAGAPVPTSAAPRNDVQGACACRLGASPDSDRRSAELVVLGGLALLARTSRRRARFTIAGRPPAA